MINQDNSGVVEAFIESLDSIFYEGYARFLVEENPEAYLFQFNEFLNLYT